jgi:competence protein ComEA
MRILYALAIGLLLFCSTLAFALAKVDLNGASLNQLESLPGIGATTAESIVAARPFRSVDELKSVKGIGTARYEKIANLVTVSNNEKSETTSSTAKTTTSSSESTVGSSATRETGKLAPGEKININTASADDLARLPGVGMHKAQAIINARPFKSPEDLLRVKGIKSHTFAKIKDNITTE